MDTLFIFLSWKTKLSEVMDVCELSKEKCVQWKFQKRRVMSKEK